MTEKQEVKQDVQEENKNSEDTIQENKETKKQEAVKQEATEKKDTVVKEENTEKEETDKKQTSAKETKKTAKASEKPKAKKDEAVVNGFSLPISTKDAVAVCRFIRYKKIDKAIEELEDVVKMRKPVPIKGEIPHKKGPGKRASGSGRFPIKASSNFLKLLVSLKANSENNGIENPVVAVAYANIATRPVGRFGRTRKKRSHVKIIAKNKNKLRKEKNK